MPRETRLKENVWCGDPLSVVWMHGFREYKKPPFTSDRKGQPLFGEFT